MNTNNCMVCGSPSVPHASKDFGGQWDLNIVDYSRCVRCGFVKSETHFAMSDEEWGRVNELCHSFYQGSDSNPEDPRWLERMQAQSDLLARLWASGLAPAGKSWLDWAAGDGKLAEMAAAQGVTLKCFDAYMGLESYLKASDLHPRSFGLVLTTSVLEHLRSRDDLDAMESLVAEDGILAIHTLVTEEIPTDPSWFYYLGPHVSFFTKNR